MDLWNADSAGVLRALWVTNSSNLTLDSGTFNIVEGDTFAGEGLISILKPGERRLLSYAADPSVHIKIEHGSGQKREDNNNDDDEEATVDTVTHLRILHGTMILTRNSRESTLTSSAMPIPLPRTSSSNIRPVLDGSLPMASSLRNQLLPSVASV